MFSCFTSAVSHVPTVIFVAELCGTATFDLCFTKKGSSPLCQLPEALCKDPQWLCAPTCAAFFDLLLCQELPAGMVMQEVTSKLSWSRSVATWKRLNEVTHKQGKFYLSCGLSRRIQTILHIWAGQNSGNKCQIHCLYQSVLNNKVTTIRRIRT